MPYVALRQLVLCIRETRLSSATVMAVIASSSTSRSRRVALAVAWQSSEVGR